MSRQGEAEVLSGPGPISSPADCLVSLWGAWCLSFRMWELPSLLGKGGQESSASQRERALLDEQRGALLCWILVGVMLRELWSVPVTTSALCCRGQECYTGILKVAAPLEKGKWVEGWLSWWQATPWGDCETQQWRQHGDSARSGWWLGCEAKEGTNLVEFTAIVLHRFSRHGSPCVHVLVSYPVLWFPLSLDFFLSSVVFLIFIMYPFTAWTVSLCIFEWEYPKGACFGGPWVSMMLGLYGQPSMGWVCPTSHRDHGQGLSFPNGPAMSSGCCDAKTSVPSQGLRLGASNPVASPCPAPPPCFHKKLVQPQGIFLLDDLLHAGWRKGEHEPLPLPAVPKPCFAPGQGLSAKALVWAIKGCSSLLTSCFEIHTLGLGL